jgi:hypothetical protein
MPFRESVVRRSREIGLDPAYVYGLIRQESRFIMDARSHVGASGLMQVMPATARWTAKRIGMTNFTLDQINDRETNIAIGTGYLKLVLDDFDGSMPLAAAAYNAGRGRPRNWRAPGGTGPVLEAAAWAENVPFNETRDYVKKVLANATMYAAILSGQPQSLKARLGSVGPRDTSRARAQPRPALRARTYTAWTSWWQVIGQTVASEFSDVPDLAQATRIVLRLMLAALLGGLLGLERENKGKAAGVRTHMLVAMGAALFVLIPQQAGIVPADLSRVIQGVVAGIGFLCAGSILKSEDEDRVRGLTTAAGMWLTAAIGMAAGLGREATAVISTVLALVILSLVPVVVKAIEKPEPRTLLSDEPKK